MEDSIVRIKHNHVCPRCGKKVVCQILACRANVFRLHYFCALYTKSVAFITKAQLERFARF